VVQVEEVVLILDRHIQDVLVEQGIHLVLLHHKVMQEELVLQVLILELVEVEPPRRE